MKAHVFLIVNSKFQLQILCSFGDNTKSVKLIGIPENNLLCIFIIASSPGVHTFVLPLESKQEATWGWNFTKCISEVKVNQLKVKICMLKWAYPPLTMKNELYTFVGQVVLELLTKIIIFWSITQDPLNLSKFQWHFLFSRTICFKIMINNHIVFQK